jgi:FkbM family methyltransferase
MRLRTVFERPEYFFRPSQILRRVAAEMRPPAPREWVRLPWGVDLEYIGTDRWIGNALRTVGVDDLPLCELLWRLARPDGRCIDVGANVRLITTLLAVRVGPAGNVLAFEPHPATFAILERNVSRLQRGAAGGNVEIRRCAVGARRGNVYLAEPKPWASSAGEVRVVDTPPTDDGDVLRTMCITLDDECRDWAKIDIVKIDVEGGQDAVIQGATELLQARRINHLIYEVSDAEEISGKLSRGLIEMGYSLWIIDRSWAGPCLRSILVDPRPVAGHATNILATVDAQEALAAVKPRGWQCLRGAPTAARNE